MIEKSRRKATWMNYDGKVFSEMGPNRATHHYLCVLRFLLIVSHQFDSYLFLRQSHVSESILALVCPCHSLVATQTQGSRYIQRLLDMARRE